MIVETGEPIQENPADKHSLRMCDRNKRLGISYDTQPFTSQRLLSLCLPNPEHLRSTHGTHTLSRRLAILHGDSLGVFHFSLGSTFHTVCLHWSTPFCYEA